MPLTMVDPQSQVAKVFTNGLQATLAIQNQNYVPILDNGTAAKVNSFEGGLLVQGAPMNVWMEGVWYTGQKEIVAPFIQSGQVPQPPAAVWNAPVVDPPADVLAQYAAAKGVPAATSLLQAYQQGSPIGGGMDTTTLVLIGVAVVGLVLLIPRKKHSAQTDGV